MAVLVTGFPTSFLATRVVKQVLAHDATAEVRCVVPARFLDRAGELRASLPAEAQPRLTLLEGDVTALDMGLSGVEYMALVRDLTRIHHCAAATYLGVERAAAERLNVGGVRELLELAESAHRREGSRFERLVHWSSALVAGARRGIVREEELERAGFRNAVEETRFRGEELVRRAMKRGLPATILRPSILVGDSKTGEIDRLEGPYLLILLMLSTPVDLRVPLPGRSEVPLNLVPIDYVLDAGCAIASDPRSIGRTFHLVDPRPATARAVFDRIAKALGRPSPRGSLPTQLATAVLRTPGLEKLAHVPRAFLEQLAVEVAYDDRNTRELLAGTGIRCPAFEQYVDVMVDYVRAQQLKDRPAAEVPMEAMTHEDASDPLG
ncbi:MAG: SDR family oxidoreductase [Deltaproteobacteria bacterium]|nr:SDR family oxidoreductase [Deltaproteobacteria bacterium]